MRHRYPGIGQFEQIRRDAGAAQHGVHIQAAQGCAMESFLYKTDRYRAFIHGFPLALRRRQLQKTPGRLADFRMERGPSAF